MKNIERLKKLAKAATQGKWIKLANEPCHKEILITTTKRKNNFIPICEMDINFDSDIGKEQKANAAYILAACPADILIVIEQHEMMLDTLNKLASWNEGAVVTSRFDNPEIALLARDTIAKVWSLST